MEGVSRPAPQVVAAKSSSSVAPIPPTTVRRYTPSQDRAAVFEICRDVYDGRDYIPRVIDDYADETDVLVECSEASGDPRALICGARDGSLYHIWGCRTHPDERGKGIMRRLMRHVEEEARRRDDSTTMVSTTIKANTAMLKLFREEGYVEHANEIWVWPDSSVQDRADHTMGFVLAHHRRATLPGALSRVTSVDGLCRALRRARNTADSNDSRWIPASYEVIACDGRTLQEAIANGNVYAIEGDAFSSVVAVVSDQLGGLVLSIVVNGATALGHVLGAVSAEVGERQIKRMYVDFAGGHRPGAADFVHADGWTSYLVLTKDSLHQSESSP